MASLSLKNIKKVYPFNGDDAKKNKKKKGEEPAKKTNLQITDEGVVAVQAFNLDIKDKGIRLHGNINHRNGNVESQTFLLLG